MSTWTIKCSSGSVTTYTELSELGLDNLRRVLNNQSADLVTFDAPGNAFADALFPDKSTVTIQKDDTTWFFGMVRLPGRSGEPSAERVSYEVFGPWYWLKALYTQTSKIYIAGSGLQDVETTSVILGQEANGDRIDTGEQIEAAVQCAIDAYVNMAGPGTEPMQIGAIDPDLEVPWEECTDITCAEVILKMLRYSPDAVCWFDYSTTPPTFRCRRGSNLPTTTLTIGAADSTVEAVAPIRPRYDLQVPGVRVIYRTRSWVTGLPGGDGYYESIDTETAGDITDIEAVILTIELAGQHDHYLVQKIETTDWPTSGAPAAEDLNDKAWWKTVLPELGGIANADMTITNGARTSALDRILSEGTIQSWMTGAGGGAIQSEACTVTARLAIQRRNANGDAVGERKDKDITVRVTATDAETRWYRKLEYTDLAEPKPTDLATKLYSAWSTLHYDGQVRLVNAECDSGLYPGYRLNLSGGRTEWETMDALVQRVSENVATGITVLTLGPPLTHRPDLRELLRKIRHRKLPKSHGARQTGNGNDGAAAVPLGGDVPQYYGGAIDGEDTDMTITYYDPATGNADTRIKLQPSHSDWEEHKVMIAQDNAGVLEVKPGWLRAHD